jgi:hypothetical protein
VRRAARVDENQRAIILALLEAGCDVLDLSAVGKGCPDLLVASPAHPHTLRLLEIKNPSKPKADQALTPAQERFHAAWKGDIHIVRTPAEALAIVGALKLKDEP